jgi:hypothetical protein
VPTNPRPAPDRLELTPDRTAPPGNVVPALARLLRRLRDRAAAPGTKDKTDKETRP